jgi:hypothetical protein
VYVEELEDFDCLHDGPVEDGGAPNLVPPEVHDQLLCFSDVGVEFLPGTMPTMVPMSSV